MGKNLEIETDENFWADVYNTQVKSTKETSLRNFQYKLLTRILPTNKFLYKCKLSDTSLCAFCGIYTETIEHLFYECKITYSIWLQLQDWLHTGNINMDINPVKVILGKSLENQENSCLINHTSESRAPHG